MSIKKVVITEKHGDRGRTNQFIRISGDQHLSCVETNEETGAEYHGMQRVTHFLSSVFLPQGYPSSVSQDYFDYQLWDTIQAFASSLSGSLATKAVLEGVGVGRSNSTPLAATLMWLIKDGAGMIGRIVFAWSKGTKLDADCKQWRLFADLLNDSALTLELCAPIVVTAVGSSSGAMTAVLCTAGLAKSIVGVAGGATRAALTQHQARQGNLADVSAKDGSQETLVNLAALLVSLKLLPLLNQSMELTWIAFILFTMLHIFANFKAVKSVRFQSLNRARFLVILKEYATKRTVPSIEKVNNSENVLLGFAPTEKQVCGYHIVLGESLQGMKDANIEESLTLFKEKNFAIIPLQSTETIYIIFKNGCSSEEMVESYFYAVISAMVASNLSSESDTKQKGKIEDAMKDVVLGSGNLSWPDCRKALTDKGWNLDNSLLTPSEWRATW